MRNSFEQSDSEWLAENRARSKNEIITDSFDYHDSDSRVPPTQPMSRTAETAKRYEAAPARTSVVNRDDLEALSHLLAQIIPTLEKPAVAGRMEGVPGTALDRSSEEITPIRKAQKLIANRQRRANFFANEIFGEPAWDLLLALYINDGRERISVSRLVQLIGVPTSTVLRWLKFLQEANMIKVRKDWRDARVSIVELEDEGRSRICSYLNEVS